MITTFQIYPAKNSGSTQFVQYIINAWNGEPVLDGHLVQGAIIHAHPETFFCTKSTGEQKDEELGCINPLDSKSWTWFIISSLCLALTLYGGLLGASQGVAILVVPPKNNL